MSRTEIMGWPEGRGPAAGGAKSTAVEFEVTPHSTTRLSSMPDVHSVSISDRAPRCTSNSSRVVTGGSAPSRRGTAPPRHRLDRRYLCGDWIRAGHALFESYRDVTPYLCG